jgi:hypothetical protein
MEIIDMMPSTRLRNLEVRLLRHYPNLWSLQLPQYFLLLAIVTGAAILVALVTPVHHLDDLPDIGRTYVIWLLLAALTFGYWAVLFLRIDHPVQRRGVGRRAVAMLGPVLASLGVLVPTWAYVRTLEHRMQPYVDSQAAVIELHVCATNFHHEHPGQPKYGEGLEKMCFDQYGEGAETKLREISDSWGDPSDAATWAGDGAGARSRELAVAIQQEKFVNERLFPYQSELRRRILVSILLYLAYVLHFCRHAPRATFGLALVATVGGFALVGVLSTINANFWRFASVLNFTIVGFGLYVSVFPARFSKHSFLFELWLCMIPLLGLCFMLFFQSYFEIGEQVEQARNVCLAAVILSPAIYFVAERFRSRPA